MIIPELAETLANSLRDFGYPDVTAETVMTELAKPADERSIVGKLVSRVLAENGLSDDGHILTEGGTT